jgi:hypothetical protein
VRPTSGTVFGILNIIFGALGLVGGPIMLAMQLLGPQQRGVNPGLDIMAASPGYYAFYMTSMVVGIVASGVLLASGIGLLQEKSFGRTLAIGYAWYSLVLVVLSFASFMIFLYPPLSDLAAKANDPTSMGAAVGGLIGGFVGLLIGPIYPGLLLYFMTRPRVVAYYSGRKPHGHDTLDTF